MNIQLSLFDQAPELTRYLYKVRFTNLYGRQCDDITKIYNTETEARQALEKWKSEAVGNTGIMTSTARAALKGLIS